jgi:hypothetical protein
MSEYDYSGDMRVFENQLIKVGITTDILDITDYIGCTYSELQGTVDEYAKLFPFAMSIKFNINGEFSNMEECENELYEKCKQIVYANNLKDILEMENHVPVVLNPYFKVNANIVIIKGEIARYFYKHLKALKEDESYTKIQQVFQLPVENFELEV